MVRSGLGGLFKGRSGLMPGLGYGLLGGAAGGFGYNYGPQMWSKFQGLFNRTPGATPAAGVPK